MGGGGGGEGVDRFVYLKNFNIVSPSKTTDLVLPLTKEQWTFISAIPIGFQVANKKKETHKNFKRLSQDVGRAKFAENLRASPFYK